MDGLFCFCWLANDPVKRKCATNIHVYMVKLALIWFGSDWMVYVLEEWKMAFLEELIGLFVVQWIGGYAK